MHNKQENISREISFSILMQLYEGSAFFDSAFNTKIIKHKLDNNQKKYIYNLVLTAIRNHILCNKIIIKFSKKKINTKSNILLIIALTQILFLKSPNYAVVNTTVDISKKIQGVNSSFINAILRKIVNNIDELNKLKINFDNLPLWFRNEVRDWNKITRAKFLNCLYEKPSLHIVFNNKINLKKLQMLGYRTTEQSMFLNQTNKIKKIPYYESGFWWVQDFSAMLPIYLLGNIKNLKTIDMCAAPGGKTLQLLSNNANLDIYEKNKKKISDLKKNLNRCGYKVNINCLDILKAKTEKYYDIAVLDAPCSAIGTIRRNPEILFRKKKPDINYLSNYQLQLLEKAANLINQSGIILYIVCSFFRKETNYVINKFLNKHKDFSIQKFQNSTLSSSYLNKYGQIKIIPTTINENYYIDGFFATILKKND